MSLEQAAINLGQAQVELYNRRMFRRHEERFTRREVAYLDHGWRQNEICPRCFFVKTPGAELCFRCRVDMQRKDPGWRGPFPELDGDSLSLR